jgi:hypothetical protein
MSLEDQHRARGSDNECTSWISNSPSNVACRASIEFSREFSQFSFVTVYSQPASTASNDQN